MHARVLRSNQDANYFNFLYVLSRSLFFFFLCLFCNIFLLLFGFSFSISLLLCLSFCYFAVPCKKLRPFGDRPGALWRSYPEVPPGVVVSLHVLARYAGRAEQLRSRACIPPFSDYIAMSTLSAARWRDARGMAVWMCAQERSNTDITFHTHKNMRAIKRKVHLRLLNNL